MGAQDPAERFFPALPPPNVRQEFLDHIRRTNAPESFSGLSRTPPPFELAGSRIVVSFKVDGAKRTSEAYIPCANCNERPKFLRGALIWSPDQKIRIIGHCCASTNCIENYREMVIQYEADEQTERNIEFLLTNMKLIPAICAETEKLRDVCQVIMFHRRSFKAQLRPLYNFIKNAHKNGGRLAVTDPNASGKLYQDLTGNRSGLRDDQILVHVVEGQEFYNDSFDAERELTSILSFLRDYCLEDKNAYFNLVGELEDNRNCLAGLAKDYRQHVDRIVKLRRRLEVAVRFFRASNLEGLRRYGGHRLADVPFTVQIDQNRVVFRLLDQTAPCAFAIGPALEVPEIFLPDMG